MAAIGSLVFCSGCGNLLDSANGDENVVLTCDVCGAKCKGKGLPKHAPSFYTRAGDLRITKENMAGSHGCTASHCSESRDWTCHADGDCPAFPRQALCSTASPEDSLHLPSHFPHLVLPATGSLRKCVTCRMRHHGTRVTVPRRVIQNHVDT